MSWILTNNNNKDILYPINNLCSSYSENPRRCNSVSTFYYSLF